MLVDAHTHRPSPHPHVRVFSLLEVDSVVPPEKAYCVGLHPWDAARAPAGWQERLREMAVQKGCVAVGETGLDRARGVDWTAQQSAFQFHWDLAEELRLPLVLHVVRASSDLLYQLKRRAPRTPWLWHGFTGPVDHVKSFLKYQPRFYFSFGPRAVAQRHFPELWGAVPAESRLLETDDSGLSLDSVYQASAADPAQILRNFSSFYGDLAV